MQIIAKLQSDWILHLAICQGLFSRWPEFGMVHERTISSRTFLIAIIYFWFPVLMWHFWDLNYWRINKICQVRCTGLEMLKKTSCHFEHVWNQGSAFQLIPRKRDMYYIYQISTITIGRVTNRTKSTRRKSYNFVVQNGPFSSTSRKAQANIKACRVDLQTFLDLQETYQVQWDHATSWLNLWLASSVNWLQNTNSQ